MQSELFREFISVVFDGNQARAGKALGLSRSAVSRICNGGRGITPAIAQRIEQVSSGRYPKERFIWPEHKAAA